MAGFYLLGSTPMLLEIIISKFEWKSYFRMQQTCHCVGELIRASKSVKICTEATLVMEQKEDGEWAVVLADGRTIDVPYGIRYNMFTYYGDGDRESLFKTMKDHRITVNSVIINHLASREKMSRTEIQTLLDVLKPGTVTLDESYATEWSLLIPLKQLKVVLMDINPIDVVLIVEGFLPLRHIILLQTIRPPGSDLLFQLVLQRLRSMHPLPNSAFFMLRGDIQGSMPTASEVQQNYADFNPVVRERQGKTKAVTCEFDNGGSRCTLYWDEDFYTIIFRSQE